MIKSLLALLLMLILITGCNTNTPVAVSTPPPGDAEPTTLPSPQAGKGALFGNLIDTRTGKPFEGNLYLAKNISVDHPELPPIVSFSYQTDPRATYDGEGNFTFNNIEPGKYVLVMWTPIMTEHYIKTIDGTEQLVMFEVKADEATDLGELAYP